MMIKFGIPIKITVEDTVVTARLADNATAHDLADQLPLTLKLNDFNRVEKIAKHPRSLSMDGVPAGDGFGTPSVIGWVGSTVHTSSRSCSLRQRSVHVVPINVPKILDQYRECRTTRPSPDSTCRWTRSTTSSATSPCAARPPDRDVKVVEHLLGQAVLGFVKRAGGHPGPVAQVLADSGGDGVVHAVRI